MNSTINNSKIITETKNYVENILRGEGSGHDWWHIYRVWKTAQAIGSQEGANLLIVELAALLHDIADWKSYGGDFTVGSRRAREWLDGFNIPSDKIAQICFIIENVSFKGVGAEQVDFTLEGKVVQDADRLDAMGAIGIARTFAYGGSKNRVIYDPDVKPVLHPTPDSYINNQSPSINHFYEKLLLLKDIMNTSYGKKLATERHEFMELYLSHFYDEWEGKR